MPSWERQTCQRKTLSACAITSPVLLVGLLMFVVIHLTFSWQDTVGEHSLQDLKSDLNDDMYNDCRSPAVVLTGKATIQMLNTSTNFSQAWRNAEKKAREPAHNYMEKHHSIAIYMYTNSMQPIKQELESVERTGKQLRVEFDTSSLYFSLSEAIQILKHSQVTCLTTNYRTETLLKLNSSDKLIRFSTFILGSDRWEFTRNASCFEVNTCFGADITYYSALKQNSQVLIPPYEIFTVNDFKTDAQRCKVMYRLKSNLNCVYDRDSNTLHPISTLPVDGLFTITCIIVIALSVPFLIVKVLENHRKTVVDRVSSLHNSTYSPTRVVI